MSLKIPRLRIFAGPNGSGKSTIKEVISKELLGIYINPDEIEKHINNYGFIDFNSFGFSTNKEEILEFLKKSTLLKTVGLEKEILKLKYSETNLFLMI
jgi:guanylate kinase